jgi:hypothetical protein
VEFNVHNSKTDADLGKLWFRCTFRVIHFVVKLQFKGLVKVMVETWGRGYIWFEDSNSTGTCIIGVIEFLNEKGKQRKAGVLDYTLWRD